MVDRLGLCVWGGFFGGGAAKHRCKATVADRQTARPLFPHTLTHKRVSQQVWPRPACARTGYRLICLISYIALCFHLQNPTKTAPDPADPAMFRTWQEKVVPCSLSDLLPPDKGDNEGELRRRYKVHQAG